MLRSSIIELNRRYKTILSAWLLFLMNPFSAVVVALNNLRESYTKNIVWLFVVYYGFTLVISNEGMDANRTRDFFISLRYTDLGFREMLALAYRDGSNVLDVAQLIISYIVSRFTSDPRILFAVFGLVFGYFYSRNIWFLIDKAGSGIKGANLIYIIVFTVIIGFWKINGFRMWTAAHVFFFGAYLFLMENKKGGLLIASSSLLFHFSYMFPLGLILIFIVLPRKVSWFYGFFLMSFIVSEIDINVFTDKLTSILPGIFHQRIEGYTSEAYLESTLADEATRNWRYDLYRQAIKWASTLLLSVIYFNGMKYLNEQKRLKNLFCFALLMMASVNLFSHIPAMFRFYPITYLVVFAFLFIYLQQAPEFRFKKLVMNFSFPLLLFYCIGQINTSLLTIGLITIIGNPVVALFPTNDFNTAIIEFLK